MTAPPSIRTLRRLTGAINAAIDNGAVRLPAHASLAIAARRPPLHGIDIHIRGLAPAWAWQVVPQDSGGNGLTDEPTPALNTLLEQVAAIADPYSTPDQPIRVLSWGRTTIHTNR